MTEEIKNRVVVIDDTGEETRAKTEEEVAKENQEMEYAFKSPDKNPEPQLDPSVLEKLKAIKMSKEEGKEMKAVAKRDRSLYFGVVGLGQAGSRVAETFYGLGYEACVFNKIGRAHV